MNTFINKNLLLALLLMLCTALSFLLLVEIKKTHVAKAADSVFVDAKKVLASITLPQGYYDSAYELGKASCDDPFCTPLSFGKKEGDYDKKNEREIYIVGESFPRMDGMRQVISLSCKFESAERLPACNVLTAEFVADTDVPDGATRLSDIRSESLTVVSSTKDGIIALGPHPRGDSGVKKYEINRGEKRLTIRQARLTGENLTSYVDSDDERDVTLEVKIR